MTQKEFEDFMDIALEKIDRKQIELYEKYRIHDYDECIYNEEIGRLQFKKNKWVELEFEVTNIGSWNHSDDIWLWAWANPSVDYDMREKSRVFRELYYKTKFDIFVDETFQCTEFMGYETSSLAVELVNGIGYYKITGENSTMFLCIDRMIDPEEYIKITVN